MASKPHRHLSTAVVCDLSNATEVPELHIGRPRTGILSRTTTRTTLTATDTQNRIIRRRTIRTVTHSRTLLIATRTRGPTLRIVTAPTNIGRAIDAVEFGWESG